MDPDKRIGDAAPGIKRVAAESFHKLGLDPVGDLGGGAAARPLPVGSTARTLPSSPGRVRSPQDPSILSATNTR
jgi:hypothetical protein